MALAKNVEAALKFASIEAEVEEVTDIVDIASFGIMSTPALVIDDQVVSVGDILSVSEVDKHLKASSE